MQAIWIYPIIFVILFFPINVILEIIISDKKGYFSFTVNFLPIVGGYCEIKNFGIAIHLSDKKAFKLRWNDVLKQKGSINKLKGLSLYSLKSCLISNIKNEAEALTVSAFVFLREIISPILHSKMPYLKIKNDVVIIDESRVSFIGQIKLWINAFYLLSLGVKVILEKVEKWKKKLKVMPKNSLKPQ